MPRDAVQAGEAVELAPQVHVLHGLFVGGAPATALPVVQPLADTFLHVLRIGVDLDMAGGGQPGQPAGERRERPVADCRLLLLPPPPPLLSRPPHPRAPDPRPPGSPA